jgi:hypothetical protein
MAYRLLAAIFALCTVAMGQPMSVARLLAFLESSEKLVAEGKMGDKELGDYVSKVRLTEKLDDRTIEELQGRSRLGPRTMAALRMLRDRSQNLAAAAPVIQPEAPKPPPPPSSIEQARILDEVRAYALGYSKRLPDFICTQVTRRYAAPAQGSKYSRGDSQPSWQSLDTLQIRLSYFDQKEEYKLTMVNNSVTNQEYNKIGGATSTGDFGTMMRQIFERSTEARFEWEGWYSVRGRKSLGFRYSVSQAKSQWHIVYERSYDIVPAYTGVIYVDDETHEITRITLQPQGIPAGFPVKRAETVLDYGWEELSGRKFLLPLKASMLMSADDYMSRNDTEFRMYRKYSADSDIKFDTEPLAPLPDDKVTEPKPIKP